MEMDCIDNKLFSKPVVIFGAAENGRKTQTMLSELEVDIKFFVDNDPLKWGQTINGISIVSPDDLFKEFKEIPIIIASTSFFEIERQLRQAGFEIIYDIGFIEEQLSQKFKVTMFLRKLQIKLQR
jgi:FlaA1/EpsC-like NDP-sugar epimerase